jgi:hypothetical protein
VATSSIASIKMQFIGSVINISASTTVDFTAAQLRRIARSCSLSRGAFFT